MGKSLLLDFQFIKVDPSSDLYTVSVWHLQVFIPSQRDHNTPPCFHLLVYPEGWHHLYSGIIQGHHLLPVQTRTAMAYSDFTAHPELLTTCIRNFTQSYKAPPHFLAGGRPASSLISQTPPLPFIGLQFFQSWKLSCTCGCYLCKWPAKERPLIPLHSTGGSQKISILW